MAARRKAAALITVGSQILGITAEIYLNKKTLKFECELLGETISEATAPECEKKVRALLRANENPVWEPVIVIDQRVEDSFSGFNNFRGGVELRTNVHVSFYRAERAARPGNSAYGTHLERCHTEDVREHSHEAEEREAGRPGHFSHVNYAGHTVMAYDERAWMSLMKLKNIIDEVRETLKKMLDPKKSAELETMLKTGNMKLLGK